MRRFDAALDLHDVRKPKRGRHAATTKTPDPFARYRSAPSTGSGAAAFGLAVLKSAPSSFAIVAATWACVASTFSRSPSAGVSGPRTAIHTNSAPGTFLP